MAECSRRHFIVLGGSVVACGVLDSRNAGAQALPVPPGDRLSFQIRRADDVIGDHELTFAMVGDELTVQIAVDIVVKFGFIPLFRYRHRATEIWQGQQVARLRTTTDDNGKKFAVSGDRLTAGLQISGTRIGTYIAPDGALPATHWNRQQLQGPMINTQDGRLMHPLVTPAGSTTLQTTSGQSLTAEGFILTGDVQLETWYDATPHWAGLRFTAADGSDVTYVLNR